jgi:O-antigen ligase
MGAAFPASRRIEFALLALLAFSLPLAEAPKNIFAALYVSLWLVNRLGSDWGGPWRHWDTLFLAWGLSGYVMAPFAGLPRNEWAGAHDLPRIAFVCWAASRARYPERAWRMLLAVIAASTAIALAQGLWRLHGARTLADLELKSVGHVNHSAIYLAIAFGLAMSGLAAAWRARRLPAGAAWGALALFFLAGVIDSASRGAFAVSVVLAVVLAANAMHRSRRLFAALCLLAAACAAIVLTSDLEIGRKLQRNMDARNVSAFRVQIWDRGLLAWRQMPVAGVGLENFGQISDARVLGWLASEGRQSEAGAYVRNSHAHSLYVNTLVERGLAGSVPVVLLLVAWAVLLARTRPGPQASETDTLVWGASFSGWFVVVAGGLINTTLHHEHGLLAALLLGAHLAHCRVCAPTAGT